MSDAGYVRIYRTLIGHPAFRNDGEALAFAWMVIRASWRPTRVRYKGTPIQLQRGQLAISVRDLGEALDRPKGWVERLLKRLKNETMIETHSETGVNVVTICNYDEFQGERDTRETPSETPKETGAGQAQDTEQRREEGKKEEEDIEPNGSCPSADAEAGPALAFGFGEMRVAALAVIAAWFAATAKQIDDDMLKPEHVRDHWNKLAKRIDRPPIRLLSPERRKLVKARIAAHPLEDFHDLFANVERSEFLRGERSWSGVTFDWLMQKKNFLKVLEGNYNG